MKNSISKIICSLFMLLSSSLMSSDESLEMKSVVVHPGDSVATHAPRLAAVIAFFYNKGQIMDVLNDQTEEKLQMLNAQTEAVLQEPCPTRRQNAAKPLAASLLAGFKREREHMYQTAEQQHQSELEGIRKRACDDNKKLAKANVAILGISGALYGIGYALTCLT